MIIFHTRTIKKSDLKLSMISFSIFPPTSLTHNSLKKIFYPIFSYLKKSTTESHHTSRTITLHWVQKIGEVWGFWDQMFLGVGSFWPPRRFRSEAVGAFPQLPNAAAACRMWVGSTWKRIAALPSEINDDLVGQSGWLVGWLGLVGVGGIVGNVFFFWGEALWWFATFFKTFLFCLWWWHNDACYLTWDYFLMFVMIRIYKFLQNYAIHDTVFQSSE